jgi:hypothetical protein
VKKPTPKPARAAKAPPPASRPPHAVVTSGPGNVFDALADFVAAFRPFMPVEAQDEADKLLKVIRGS